MSSSRRSTVQPSSRLTDRKRAAIVHAAVSEFQSRGYFSTSMNLIASAANVSKRTLYNHFESKESLFEAIIAELGNQADSLPVCTFNREGDLAEQLYDLATIELEFLTSASVQALARAGLSRILAEPHVGKMINPRRFRKRVEAWLKDAIKAGSLRPIDADFAAQQFVGLLAAFAFWPTIAGGEPVPGKKKRERIIRSTVEMFLRYHQDD